MPVTRDDEILSYVDRELNKRKKFPAAPKRPDEAAMADPNARGIALAPNLMDIREAPPGGIARPAMATAPAPTPGKIGAAEAYGNVNLDREEVMKKLWLTKYGNDRAGAQAQFGSPASLIQNRWDLERSANTLRPAAVAPTPVMDPEQEALSRQSIAAAMATQNGIDYRAASAEQPGWAPPRTDADFARNAKAKEMGLGPGMMWDLERLKGLPGQGVTIPTPASERTYANPDALAPVRTERQYSDEVNRRNAPYEAANAPGSPAMRMLDTYNANRQSGMEMEALRRKLATNQLETAAVVSDPKLARERMTAETEGLKLGTDIRRVEGEAKLGEAKRSAAAGSIPPEVNSALGNLIARAGSIGGGGIGMTTGPQESEQVAADTERQVDTILSAIRSATPEQRSQMIAAVDTAIANLRTTPGPVTGLIGAGTTNRYYAALSRLRAGLTR